MTFSLITFTYNGMLKTNEIAGEGNSFQTEFRQYDSRLGRWMSLDKLHFIYASHSPFNYALNNPIAGKDDNGLYTIFVNGYIYGGPNRTVVTGPGGSYQVVEHNDDILPGRPYWSEKGNQFIDAAHNYFGDGIGKYVNGSGEWMGSTASSRQDKGRELGKLMAKEIIAEINKLNSDLNPDGTLNTLNDVKEINFVTHSMGTAVSEGMIEEFMKHDELKKLLEKGQIVHLSACDGDKIKISENSKHLDRLQLNIDGDKTLFYADRGSVGPTGSTYGYHIDGVKKFGLINEPNYALHPKADWKTYDPHYDTKTFGYIWKYVRALNNKKSQNGTQIKLDRRDIDEDEPMLDKNGRNYNNK